MQYGWYDNIVILGDFNSDLLIANNNTLIETMMMFSLVNIISKPQELQTIVILYLILIVLVEIHSLANSRNILVN
jgi:hypothetical protein